MIQRISEKVDRNSDSGNELRGIHSYVTYSPRTRSMCPIPVPGTLLFSIFQSG